MIRTLIITTGWCGFGRTGGLFPEIRLGLLSVGWCRGSLREHVAAMLATQMQRSVEAIETINAKLRELSR